MAENQQDFTAVARRQSGARRRPSLGWLSIFSVALILGCSLGSAEPPALLARYDVILVVVDTLRPDHLGTHAYARDTSPLIDSLARQGIVFESAVSNSSYTRESVAAILTGQLPSRSGAFGWLAEPNRAAPYLGEIFRRAGYRTALYSNTYQLALQGFARGFDEFHFPTKDWRISGEGRRLSKRALDFVGEAGEQPVFLYLHYLDPHAPYDPAPRLRRRFEPAPLTAPLDLYDQIVPRIGELVAGGFGPGEPRFEDLVARYDAEIASTDEALRHLLRGIAASGRIDRTLLVLTADHGEEFLEHGFVDHAWTLYEESIRVPLVFWAADSLEPTRVNQRVSLVDVFPTILGLVGIERPDEALDGTSLLEPETGRPVEQDASRAHVSELLIEERNVVRAVIREEWKYLAVHRWRAPEERGRSTGGETEPLNPNSGPIREELYDLAQDPREQEDRSSDAPDRLASMRRALREYLESTGFDYRTGESTERRPDTELSPEMLERLRALGYRQAE